MFRSLKFIAAAGLLLGMAPALAAENFHGIGRAATQAEIQAWDIDVRPDFKGLPAGSGSVDRGQTVWEEKCATCHGVFGEANSVFTPLVGGVTKEDMDSGHVANLKRRDYPQRTTFMKVATVSTLYDYIRRAMPWNAPKSLSDDDVYAVLAYLLNLNEIVPSDFVLSDKNMAEVQKRMPNRLGMTTDHSMWPGSGITPPGKAPDTKNTACMKNCKKQAEITSHLPDYAEDSHGNLAAQNRLVGQVRGRGAAPEEGEDAAPAGYKLAESNGCLGCHGVANKIVGPGYNEVFAKYKGQNKAAALIAKVKEGGEGAWGSTPMPPQEVSESDAKTMVEWILAGAPMK